MRTITLLLTLVLGIIHIQTKAQTIVDVIVNS